MKRFVTNLLTIVISVLAFSATAATVVYDGNGEVTGINGLDVNSTVYNVVFTTDKFDNLWPTDDPTFWGSQTNAEAASDAINTVLTGESPDPQIAPNTSYYFVPFANIITVTGDTGVINNALDFGWSREGVLSRLSASSFSYAVFSSPVPIPAAIWLFGSGLLGLIGISRRKKAA